MIICHPHDSWPTLPSGSVPIIPGASSYGYYRLGNEMHLERRKRLFFFSVCIAQTPELRSFEVSKQVVKTENNGRRNGLTDSSFRLEAI